MISPTLSAEIAQLHQAEMRATASRLSLSRLFRRSPEPESAPRPDVRRHHRGARHPAAASGTRRARAPPRRLTQLTYAILGLRRPPARTRTRVSGPVACRDRAAGDIVGAWSAPARRFGSTSPCSAPTSRRASRSCTTSSPCTGSAPGPAGSAACCWPTPPRRRDARRLCRDLRWLGVTVGRVRDLDVIRERLAGLDGAPELLDGERATAVDEVRTALERRRARHLHRDLAALLEPARWSGLTQAPLAEVAPRVLEAERRRVLRRDRAAEHAEADRAARLHDVRKAAKRLRYAAEAAGEPALAERAEALQELLGAGNDALMTAAWLDRTARELPEEADRLRAESTRQWAEARLDDAAYTRAIEALRATGI